MRIAILIFLGLLSSSFVHAQIKQISEEEIEDQTKYISALTPSIIGEAEESIERLEKFKSEHPTSAATHYQLARLYEATDRPEDAKNAIRKATTLKPEVEWYWIVQAEMMRSYNEWSLAADAYKKLTELRPDKSNYSISLAHAYLQLGDSENCLKVLDDLEQNIGIQEKISLKRTQVFEAMEKWDAAEQELIKLTQHEPSNTDYLLRLAGFYRDRQMEKPEIEVYKRILSIDSSVTKARIQLSELESDNGSELLQELRAIIKDPESPIDLKVRKLIPFLQAVNSDEPTEIQELISILEDLVKTHPRDAKSYTMLADGYFNTGQLRASLEAYQQAEKLEPGIATVWKQHLETLLYLDEYEETLTVTEQALIYFPNQVEFYLIAAEAAIKNGDASRAKSYLSSCEFMLGKDEILRQKLQAIRLSANEDPQALQKWMDEQASSKFTLPEAAILLFELNDIRHQGFIDQVILQAKGPLKGNYQAQLAAAYATAEINAWQSTKEYLDHCLRLGGSLIPDTFLLLKKTGRQLQNDDYISLAEMRLERMGYTTKNTQ